MLLKALPEVYICFFLLPRFRLKEKEVNGSSSLLEEGVREAGGCSSQLRMGMLGTRGPGDLGREGVPLGFSSRHPRPWVLILVHAFVRPIHPEVWARILSPWSG